MDLYSSRLYYYAYGIICNKEMAEEVVSDVFYEVWKRRKEMPSIENILSWLLMVTHNKSLSYVQKEKNKRNSISFDDLKSFAFPIVESSLSRIISCEEITSINNAINKLPPRCRDVFFMAKIEHMKYADIADFFGISLPTVNYHIAFAVSSLRKMLKTPL
ncbi:MAG: RNA polymerase sigma-70 factor [Prevotella sp.]|nr:RNA polymerase sigma-70 factor [Prevotella sp.]MCI1281936.1 RNA polymerase sigma-70 factor [Prevotella sp.]